MAKAKVGTTAKGDVEVARALGKAYWREVVRQTNPTIGKEELKANWNQARSHYMKLGRKALRALERAGYKVQNTAKPATPASPAE